MPTTTNLPLPPPLPQQSTSDSDLASRVAALKQKLDTFKQKNKTLDNTTQNLGSRVFNLELCDLLTRSTKLSIDQTMNTVIKEAVHIALQAPLRDRFRELPEADMKEILHQRISFKQQSASHSEQPIKGVPITDNVNVLDSKDTNTAHLPKLKTRPDWMKSVPEEDRPATQESNWVIPPNELSEPENNWANALASSELPEADMKEILHQRMFGSGSYKSLPEHVALYEALEASMKWAQRDEFLAIKDKSRKRRRDDQDPPPPPPESDLSKRRRHDTDASGSSHPQAPQSSAWKKSDTQDALSSSSKQQFGPYTEQLLNLTKPGWDAKGFEYKHDYTIIDSPRAVVFPVGNNERKITSKRSGQALSISKMKDARYLDFGLKPLVPEHMWINE
nr:hypothetical protein [Tanacetum cinerariifolium]